MLKKIDIYIIKKFLGTFFLSITLIISIAVVFDAAEKLDDFIQKEAPMKAIIFDYYMNFIPYFANLFSSLFTFIAVIFFTSKLAARSEIIAILSSGVSFNRLLYPYFVAALVIAVFSFGLRSYIIPQANKERLAFENTYIRNAYRNVERNIHKQLEPGVFIYMESYNNFNDIGYKFAIEKFEDGELVSKLNSSFIQWDTTINKWMIHNYVIRHIDGLDETIEKGTKIDTTLSIQPSDFERRLSIVEAMNNDELDQYIEELQMQGSGTVVHYLLEKYKRIAFPFSTFILTLIGVSLASRRTRGGTGLHIGLGLLISFAYILFMQLSTNFAIGGSMSPLLAVWIPNILFTIIALFLYRITPK